jgi:hypothetical protein
MMCREVDINSDPTSNPAGEWSQFGYSIMLAIWASLFIELWKRKSATLAYRWGTSNYEETERERAEFKGELREGLWVNNEWVPWELVDSNWRTKSLEDQAKVPKNLYLFMRFIAQCLRNKLQQCFKTTIQDWRWTSSGCNNYDCSYYWYTGNLVTSFVHPK